MARPPAKKSAKTGAKPPKAPAKAAKKKPAAKAARPRAKAIRLEAPELEDMGVGAAAVEEPRLHEAAHVEPAAEEPLGEEPESPAEPTPEGVPAPEGDWAARVAAARAPLVHFEEESGTVQVEADPEEVPMVTMDEEVGEETPRRHAPVAPAGGGIGIPEQFLTIAIDGQWDDRMERVKPGRMGAALAGSVLLELAVHGKLRVHQGRYAIGEEPTGDADLDHFAEQVRELGPVPTEQALRRLGRHLPDRLRPWKQRVERRGWLREERRKFLGLFPRSTTTVLDAETQGKLQNRLVRMLAGGGNPDVKSIALLGLIQAAGLLPQLVPSSALPFNEKRITLLLSGRDPLHYRVDTSVHQVQDAALRTILADVRKLS